MSDTEEVTEHILPTPSRAGLTDHKGAIGGIYNGLGAQRDDIIPPERQKLKGASHIKHTSLTALSIKLNQSEIKTGTSELKVNLRKMYISEAKGHLWCSEAQNRSTNKILVRHTLRSSTFLSKRM